MLFSLKIRLFPKNNLWDVDKKATGHTKELDFSLSYM